MDLLMLATSVACQRLSFLDFGSVGSCLVETTMFGDVALAGVIIFVLFTALLIRYNFPVTMIIPVGIALAYVLYIMTYADIFLGILILGLIIGGAILIISLLSYLNR